MGKPFFVDPCFHHLHVGQDVFPRLDRRKPLRDGIGMERQRVLEIKVRGGMDHSLHDGKTIKRNAAQVGLCREDIEAPLFYVCGRQLLRGADPLHHDVGQFFVGAEGLGIDELHVRIEPPRLVDHFRDVPGHMQPCAQEERVQNDLLRAP